MSFDKNQHNNDSKDLEAKILAEKNYLEQLKKIDTDKAWEGFQKKITKQSHKSIPLWKHNFYKYAAVILLFLVTATILYLLKFNPPHNYEITKSGNQLAEVILPDGSKVILAESSTLYHPEKFRSSKRVVKMIGEAYFEVERNEKASFMVELNNTTIKVLGTSFTIKEKKNKHVDVQVISGEVLFYETTNKENSLVLQKGEKGTFNIMSRNMVKDTFDIEKHQYWKSIDLSFVDEHLPAVFKELEKTFGVTMLIKDNELLKDSITSDFRSQNLDEILEELSLLFNLSYQIQNDTVYIRSVTK